MRLIDADELKATIECQKCMSCNSHNGARCSMCETADDIDSIDNSPTIDAEPVRHGRWDVSLDGMTPFCTECGMSRRLTTRIPKYCPNCGAKMDAKEA